MRTEEIVAKAMEHVGEDRYVLASLVFARVKELSNGAKPTVDMDLKLHKLADIAMMEIAEGNIVIDRMEPITKA